MSVVLANPYEWASLAKEYGQDSHTWRCSSYSMVFDIAGMQWQQPQVLRQQDTSHQHGSKSSPLQPDQ